MSKQDAVITYISGITYEDYKELQLSLYLLYKNFNLKYRYPIVIFHENLTKNDKDKILGIGSKDITFCEVELKPPDFITNIPENICGATIGYRNMIRFVSRPM